MADWLGNIADRKSRVVYITGGSWSPWWDGYYITRHLPVPARMSTTVAGCRRRIVHLGFFDLIRRMDAIPASNQTVLTVFHIGITTQKQDLLRAQQRRLARIHTSCTITRNRLINSGVAPDDVTVIPLGVDRDLFCPPHQGECGAIRRELGIPEEAFVIGSFQKDGTGWGAGMEPKYIKGPDTFCTVVERMAQTKSVHVLLTGPARGYVIDRLTAAGIPYTHHVLSSYPEIARYYRALDMYLMASREEGGPKALLESWASGVPLVATRVGMVPDAATDGQDALLADPEDSDRLLEHTQRLRDDIALRASLSREGRRTVQHYGWQQIANRYWHELYKPIIENS